MSITGAAMLPASPMLARGLSGQTTPAPDLRTAALAVIDAVLLTEPDAMVVIASGDDDGTFDETAPLRLHRLGGLRQDPRDASTTERALPIPLAIAASLLREAGWKGPTSYRSLDASASTATAEALGQHLAAEYQRVGVLLLANGSARCTAGAPGSFDSDAAAFNADLLAFLGSRDPDARSRLTAQRCVEQMSDAYLAMRTIDAVLPIDSTSVSIAYADEFRGVFFVCATFLPQGGRKADAE